MNCVIQVARRQAISFNKRFIQTTAKRSGDNFRVLGLQQIAVGGLSKEKLANLWIDTLGLDKVGTGPTSVEVDIMQPLDPEKSPKVNSPPLNHIGLWVDDIHAAVDELTAKGCRFTPGGVRKGASGHEVTFIHPKGNDEFPICGEGVLIELVQAPEDVIKFYS